MVTSFTNLRFLLIFVILICLLQISRSRECVPVVETGLEQWQFSSYTKIWYQSIYSSVRKTDSLFDWEWLQVCCAHIHLSHLNKQTNDPVSATSVTHIHEITQLSQYLKSLWQYEFMNSASMLKLVVMYTSLK